MNKVLLATVILLAACALDAAIRAFRGATTQFRR